MSSIKTLASLFASTTLALALAGCGTSVLGGGSGAGGSGASGGSGGSSGDSGAAGSGAACQGPDPSAARCDSDADCDADEICSPEACAPSGCGCDPLYGWQCTADCGPGCVPSGGGCQGPNPSDKICADDSDCTADEVCDFYECTSSGCLCDATTGQWVCDSDCRPSCVPAGSGCSGVNPAAGSCFTSDDCPGGQTCSMAGCQPGSCDCVDGDWLCTDDCKGSCVQGSGMCAGENPQGCKLDGCPDGQICAEVGCTSSSCVCDANTGLWACDDDCGGGTCVPEP